MALASADIIVPVARRHWLSQAARRHPTVIAGTVILLLMVAIAAFAPFLGTVDPVAVSPVRRFRDAPKARAASELRGGS